MSQHSSHSRQPPACGWDKSGHACSALHNTGGDNYSSQRYETAQGFYQLPTRTSLVKFIADCSAVVHVHNLPDGEGCKTDTTGPKLGPVKWHRVEPLTPKTTESILKSALSARALFCLLNGNTRHAVAFRYTSFLQVPVHKRANPDVHDKLGRLAAKAARQRHRTPAWVSQALTQAQPGSSSASAGWQSLGSGTCRQPLIMQLSLQ
jgi:hypothetical protein